MSCNKKPSGSFHRKRKLQHSIEDEKQSKALQKFFTTSPSSISVSTVTGQIDDQPATNSTKSDHGDGNDVKIDDAKFGPPSSSSSIGSETLDKNVSKIK